MSQDTATETAPAGTPAPAYSFLARAEYWEKVAKDQAGLERLAHAQGREAAAAVYHSAVTLAKARALSERRAWAGAVLREAGERLTMLGDPVRGREVAEAVKWFMEHHRNVVEEARRG